MAWTLTTRAEARVGRERFEQLDEALGELERRGRELAASPRVAGGGGRVLRYEPVQLVSVRLEISGPQRFLPDIHAGVDIRGDGSVEAFTGRVRKQVIEPRGGEDVYAALRRELTARASSR